jgi:hypothetical protein
MAKHTFAGHELDLEPGIAYTAVVRLMPTVLRKYQFLVFRLDDAFTQNPVAIHTTAYLTEDQANHLASDFNSVLLGLRGRIG